MSPAGLIRPPVRQLVQKPWGREDIPHNGSYCLKRLFVDAGKSLSWQFHIQKEETLLLVLGRARLVYREVSARHPDRLSLNPQLAINQLQGAGEVLLQPGDVFHIPPFCRHRLMALEACYV